MIQIGFVMPSSRQNERPFRNQPLVLMYLLAILERELGDKVGLSLIDLRGIDEDSLLYHIPEKDLYMYSVATLDFAEVADIVRKLKVIYPKAKHVAGGPHINIFPDESAIIFDSLVLGEGEETIVRLVKDFQDNRLQPVYRQGEPVDLNAYPYPDRSYSPRKAVVDEGLLGGDYLHLPGTIALFSRGCPFNCYFCANKDLTFGPVRFRSPALIEKEIEYLKKEYGVKALAIKDDNSIPTDRRIARPMLEAIGRTGIKWRGQSRANGVHPEMVKLAAEAGCVDIAVGIESACQEVLEIVNKKIQLDKAKEYIHTLRDSGIGVRLLFIIGLPGEPEDVVERTLKFIEEAEPNSVLLSILTPLPGSELFKEPERFGIKLMTRDWRKYSLTAGRFDENEMPTIVFEYEETTPWGKGTSMEKIYRNYVSLQAILRERGLNF